MFGRLLNILNDPAPALDPLASDERELALAALLVRLARSDGNYDDEEKVRIDRVLAARNGLSTREATELRHHAEEVEVGAPDTVRFTRALKDKVAYEDRTGVIEALWDVALADGVRDVHEETLIRLASKLLGVNDVDSALARQRVEARRT
ncbi:TerB family tellurite resistance protein [Thioclava sp.]|uniref:tellurite resistance TerB family protein n=1 Tax=Thioclava sp. TaxID=1933450 RepID=UPI003AA9C4DB